MTRSTLAMLAIALGGAQVPPGSPAARMPVLDAASFNPLPEMWGLRVLGGEARLEELDASTVLYLSKRAVLEIDAERGQVCFAAGRQLLAGPELTGSETAELLGLYPCLCAMEYQSRSPGPELHAAAGVYRLARAPSVGREAGGAVRVEFELLAEGQPDRVTLRRLVCWSSAGDSLAPVAGALPRFAALARKDHPAFADPAMDDRPVQEDPAAGAPSLAWMNEPGATGATGRGLPRLDAPELLGLARPGLATLLREIGSGRKEAIDLAGYVSDSDPFARRFQRQIGACTRDSLWP